MIIGKDKERVRLMEVDLKLARELIEQLQSDMEEIAHELKTNTLVETMLPPYYKLYHDIGRCSGWLSEERRHKG
jgi:hypothetical protein